MLSAVRAADGGRVAATGPGDGEKVGQTSWAWRGRDAAGGDRVAGEDQGVGQGDGVRAGDDKRTEVDSKLNKKIEIFQDFTKCDRFQFLLRLFNITTYQAAKFKLLLNVPFANIFRFSL